MLQLCIASSTCLVISAKTFLRMNCKSELC
jgi:hypothetical protein